MSEVRRSGGDPRVLEGTAREIQIVRREVAASEVSEIIRSTVVFAGHLELELCPGSPLGTLE
jgi:hypothetical protein